MPHQGIFALYGGDRADGMGLANGFWADFAQAEMFCLAFTDQIGNGSGRIFNRNLRVETVLIKQVDSVGSQSFQ